MPVWLFAPLALYLATASRVGQTHLHISTWFVPILLAYCLVYQFRIWDDLASLSYDRKHFPERVMCRAESLAPFHALAAALFATNLFLLRWYSGDWIKPGALLMLCGVLLAGYRWRSEVSSNNLISAQFVLLKYPLIVWILSTPMPGQHESQLLVVSMLAVYFVFAVHEILHDERCQQAAGANLALTAQVTALCVVWILMALLTQPRADSLVTVQWVTVVIGLTIAVLSYVNYKKRPRPTLRGYALFLVGGLVTFNMVLGKQL